MTFAKDFFHRAVGCFDGGHYDQAADIAAAGLEQFPEDGILWQMFGTAQWLMNKHSEAQNSLETATCLSPLAPLSQYALASLYADAKKADLAGMMFAYLAAGDGCPTSLLPKIASRLGHMQKHRLALTVCETLLGRNPVHHEALFGVAFYKSRLDFPPEESIGPLAMAMDLAPHIVKYRLNLALLWIKAGNPAKAYDLFKEVDIDRVHCPFWLHKMIAVFDRFADYDRCWSCMKQLEKAKETHHVD